jgi:hypothetical protein
MERKNKKGNYPVNSFSRKFMRRGKILRRNQISVVQRTHRCHRKMNPASGSEEQKVRRWDKTGLSLSAQLS